MLLMCNLHVNTITVIGYYCLKSIIVDSDHWKMVAYGGVCPSLCITAK
jgi:hypothetical protein